MSFLLDPIVYVDGSVLQSESDTERMCHSLWHSCTRATYQCWNVGHTYGKWTISGKWVQSKGVIDFPREKEIKEGSVA